MNLSQRVLGAVLLSRHKFAEAAAEAERLAARRPNDAALQGIIGDGRVELGDYDEGFAAFNRMMAIRPDAASSARVSYARELQGDLRGALNLMRMAAEATSPRDVEAQALAYSRARRTRARARPLRRGGPAVPARRGLSFPATPPSRSVSRRSRWRAETPKRPARLRAGSSSTRRALSSPRRLGTRRPGSGARRRPGALRDRRVDVALRHARTGDARAIHGRSRTCARRGGPDRRERRGPPARHLHRGRARVGALQGRPHHRGPRRLRPRTPYRLARRPIVAHAREIDRAPAAQMARGPAR